MLVKDRKDTKSPEAEERITHHLDYMIYQRICPVINTLYIGNQESELNEKMNEHF